MKILSGDFSKELYNKLVVVLTEPDTTNAKKLFKLKRLFFSIFAKLQTSENITFSDPNARIKYVCDNFELSPEFITRIKTVNAHFKIASKQGDVKNTLIYAFAREIVKIVNSLSEESVSSELQEVLDDFKDKSGKEIEFVLVKQEETEGVSRRVNFLSVTKIEKKQSLWERIATVSDPLTLNEYKLKIETSVSADVLPDADSDINFFDKIPKYATLNLINVKPAEQDPNTLILTKNSFFVYEPDYLIDASELAECFSAQGGNHRLSLISKLKKRENTKPILIGNWVNQLLDEGILHDDIDFDEEIDNIRGNNPLSELIFGSDAINEVVDTIRIKHLPAIVKFTQNFRNRNVKARLEPTFISNQYGVQGRLDVLYENAVDKTNLDIVELKSGGAPSLRPWKNHTMQVACYYLMLSSALDRGRKGTNSILYSQNISGIPTAAPLDADTFSALFRVRNYMVAMYREIAEGKFSIFNDFNTPRFGICNKFDLEFLAAFNKIYSTSSNVKKKYFLSFLRFVVNELFIGKIGGINDIDGESGQKGYSALWLNTLEEKKEFFTILDGLEFATADKKAGIYTFNRNNKDITTLREGDLIVIYPFKNEETNPLKGQIVKGTISKLTLDEVTIALKCSFLNDDYFDAFDEWIAESDFTDIAYRSMFEALFTFLTAGDRKTGLLLGQIRPVSKSRELDLESLYKNLTKSHLENLKKCIEAEDYYLLQGPPGTGKTSSFLTALTHFYALVEKKSVLLTAFTNRAVREICDNLQKKKIPYVLISSAMSDDENHLNNIIRNYSAKEAKEIINSRNVVVSTSLSYAMRKSEISALKKFDLIVVDEASQITEPGIIGVLAEAEKFILIGDQNQLPCVITQSRETSTINDTELSDLHIGDLRCSIFERLIIHAEEKGWSNAYGMLTHHFRMHDDISTLINPFYDNKLLSFTAKQREELEIKPYLGENAVLEAITKSRVVFVNSKYERRTKSNLDEAKKCADIVRMISALYGNEFNDDVIGIVTPWRTQISLIKNELGDEALIQKVLIDTVERFQGSEKKIIIISTAVNSFGMAERMQSFDAAGRVDRKLNVAISRAKESVILLGNENILSALPGYRELLEKVKSDFIYLA